MSSEHSGLTALAELKRMEDARIAAIAQAEHEAAERARRQQEERIRQEREAAEARRHAEQQRKQQEQLEREAREREERIRIAEAEARAAAERDARVREEQMRLEAQVKLAERKQRPVWLYGLATVLTLGVMAGGAMFYFEQEAAAEDQAKLEAQKAEAERKAAQLGQELDRMAAERDELSRRQAELDAALVVAKNDAERADLERQKAELAARQKQLHQEIKKTKAGSKRPPKTGGKQGPTRPPIVLEDPDGDPLGNKNK